MVRTRGGMLINVFRIINAILEIILLWHVCPYDLTVYKLWFVVYMLLICSSYACDLY